MGQALGNRSQAAQHAQIGDSLAGLAVGTITGFRDREEALEPLMGSDMVQHVKVLISGKVGKKPTVTRATVMWPHPIILDDPSRSESDLTEPQASHMIEASGPFCAVYPQIVGWVKSPESYFIGAELRIGAWIPEAPKRARISVVVHLSFYGWAAPAEEADA